MLYYMTSWATFASCAVLTHGNRPITVMTNSGEIFTGRFLPAGPKVRLILLFGHSPVIIFSLKVFLHWYVKYAGWAEKHLFVDSDLYSYNDCFYMALWKSSLQSEQYLPVSVEVGWVNRENYARHSDFCFANIFQWELLYTAFFTLRCKQILRG